jgi:hypothetical protein
MAKELVSIAGVLVDANVSPKETPPTKSIRTKLVFAVIRNSLAVVQTGVIPEFILQAFSAYLQRLPASRALVNAWISATAANESRLEKREVHRHDALPAQANPKQVQRFGVRRYQSAKAVVIERRSVGWIPGHQPSRLDKIIISIRVRLGRVCGRLGR